MGSIISLDNNEGDLPDVLTRTGQGGFLSPGYLRETPAATALQEDETPRFVLTSSKHGVSVESNGERTVATPGDGYRTITVVSDRRIVVLVGDVDGGDRQLSVPFPEIEGVESHSRFRHGRITITRTGGTILEIHAGTDGLERVVTYLRTVSQAWLHVETVLDDAREALEAAGEARREGDIDGAREANRRARDHLDAARATVDGVPQEQAAAAMNRQVETVADRAVAATCRLRFSQARQALNRGLAHWQDREYEAAYDSFERAGKRLDTVLARPPERVPNLAAVRAERERIDAVLDRFTGAPVRAARRAVEDARRTDDQVRAASCWEDALQRYRTVLRLDWGADRRRFDGDPGTIRDLLGTIAENLTATRRKIASDATEAGDWYASAGQYRAAIEEFETARAEFETALTTAADCYPDAVEHLRTELDAVERRIERANAELSTDRDPEELTPTAAADGRPDSLRRIERH